MKEIKPYLVVTQHGGLSVIESGIQDADEMQQEVERTHMDSACVFDLEIDGQTMAEELLSVLAENFPEKFLSVMDGLPENPLFLDTQREDPFELCHFDCAAADSALGERLNLSKAFASHIFGCYRHTQDESALALLPKYFGLPVNSQEKGIDGVIDALIATKNIEGVGESADNKEWLDLARIYTKHGYPVYVSDSCFEVYSPARANTLDQSWPGADVPL